MSKLRNKISTVKRGGLDYYLKLPYTIVIIPEETGGFFAKIDELRGCMTQGDTIDETMKNIEEAKHLWLETALKKKIEIPLPESKKEYSGRFLIRIPAYLHKRLASLAKKEGVSLNQMALSLLSEKITIKEIRTEIQTAVWEIERKTKTEYEFKYSTRQVAQPEVVYDTLSEKRKIPQVKWSKTHIPGL